jgi:hypothetical protein
MVEWSLAIPELSRRAAFSDRSVWGINYLVEVLLRVGFALILSPAQVVAISPVMAFSVMVVLIAWTRRYMLALRERRIREQAAEAQRS